MAVLFCIAAFALGILVTLVAQRLARRRKEGISRLIEIAGLLRKIEWRDGADALAGLDTAVGLLVDIYDRELSYYRRRRNQAGVAKGFRWLAWIIGALGALCPLIAPLFPGVDGAPAVLPGLSAQIGILPLGYTLLALAGALLAANRFLGLTEGHIRYSITQIKLEAQLNKLSYEWLRIKSRISTHVKEEDFDSVFKLLESQIEALGECVADETNTWAAQTAAQEAAHATSYKQ